MNVHNLPDETKKYLSKIGYSGMFAHRQTPQEAMDYVQQVAAASGKNNTLAVITAAQVLLNTMILYYMENGIIKVPAEGEATVEHREKQQEGK